MKRLYYVALFMLKKTTGRKRLSLAGCEYKEYE